jgi:hypothetical protein
MEKILSTFKETFSHWEIQLPAGSVANRSSGKIMKAGWCIWYLFGSDENGDYLDYYASHRMTDDRHVRIHIDGTCESLPAIETFRLCSEDPLEDKRLDDEFTSNNKKVSEMLQAKGFGLTGNEPGSVQINRFLHTGGGPDESG